LTEDDVFTAIISLPGSVIPSITETMTVSGTEGEAAVLGLVTENPALTQAAMAQSLETKGMIRREGSDKQGTWQTIPPDQHDS
jgi:hypothetical protein